MVKKISKLIPIALIAIFVTIGASTTVFADIITETEPNDTMEQAQEVEYNLSTAQAYIDANNTVNKVVKGSVSGNTDTDWFKVFVTAGKASTYITIDPTNPVYYTILDAKGNTIVDRTLNVEGPSSWHVAEMHLSSGYYYIKLEANSYESYQFTFGNNIYRTGSIRKESPKITLSSSHTSEAVEHSIDSIPSQSQVYQIGVNGVLSSYASKVSVKYSNSSQVITKTESYAWGTLAVPLSFKYGYDGKYTFTYYYKNATKTFTPLITYYYVYPLLP